MYQHVVRNIQYVKHPFYLLLGTVEELPTELSEEKNEVIYCLEEFDETVEVDKLTCHFFILIISKTQGSIGKAFALARECWEELSDGEIKLDLVTNDYHAVQKHIKEPYETAKLESVTFKLPPVAFLESSFKAKKEAKQLILDSALKNKWQFWK